MYWILGLFIPIRNYIRKLWLRLKTKFNNCFRRLSYRRLMIIILGERKEIRIANIILTKNKIKTKK